MLMVIRDIYRFFSASLVASALLIVTLVGLLLSLSHPNILPPIIFFGGVWFTKLLWFLLGFSILMLFIKRIVLFAKNAEQRGFLFAASKAITSIPLAVTLIGLIILLGLIQTFVPQHSFNRIIDLETRFGTANYELLNSLLVFDIFSSWYLYAIVGLFVVNLAACTVKRLRASFLYVKQEMKPKSVDSFERMPQHHAISTKGLAPELALQRVKSVLRSKGFGVQESTGQLLAEKRRWERFSIDIFHIALITTILALAVSGLYGYNNIFVHYSGDVFPVPHRDFRVEVVDFDLINYTGTERVMDWWTELNIIEDGEVVKNCRIEVNHPCYHHGMGIYQAAMGDDWLGSAVVTFEVRKKDFTDNAMPKLLGEYQVKVGESFEIPEENLNVDFNAFLPDFAFHGNTMYSKTQTLNNPAARLNVSALDGSEDPSKNFVTLTLKNVPALQAEIPDQDYMFLIEGMKASQFTGLELSADPGKGIAYFSFSIIMLTLMGHLLFNHQMLWVGINSTNGMIIIGGRARKGDFAEQFEKISEAVESSLDSITEPAETGVVT